MAEEMQYDTAKRINIVPGDLVSWEAVYSNGFVFRERAGFKYADIDRERLVTFKLVEPGGVLVESWPPTGADGRNLIYRRRTQTNGIDRSVIFLIGWAPMGPAIMVDPANGRYREEPGFIVGDPDMYPPTFIPEEDGQYLYDLVTKGMSDSLSITS